MLGLTWATPRTVEASPDLLLLLDERQKARAERDFSKADALRRELSRRGFVVEDRPDGPLLHRVR